MKEIETQNIEWKESWRDEYLKWICGFANADGGVLLIGKRDDGSIAGLADAKKLMEDIPNKVRDIMGIMVDVNLKEETGSQYLEIVVESYPNPVSYKGQYHYRSGSTKQELKGPALDSFLLKKHGLHWDGVPNPRLAFDDIDNKAITYFVKKGVKSGRLDATSENDSKEELFAKLKLTEKNYIKRAAALLFCEDPENYVGGAYVKIGFFRTNTELIYQDEVHGNIFYQVDKTLELLTTKYMKAYIRYEGIQRIEQFLFPPVALREVITNAIVHKDYASANPIQISVYEEQIIIWNSAQISDELPIERLLGKHPSIPYNPLLAGAFFRSGYIEAWGRGIEKIKNECLEANAKEPEIKYNFGGVMVTFTGEVPSEAGVTKHPAERFRKDFGKISEGVGKESENHLSDSKERLWKKYGRSTEEIRKKYGITAEKTILNIINNPHITIKEIAELLLVSQSAVEKNIAKLKKDGLLQHKGSTKSGYWEVLEKK